MLLDSKKVLFSLNSEFCPNKSYGFVKKSFFELFNNLADWSCSLKCKIGESCRNHITLLSLEGIDFAFDFCTNFSFLLRCQDGSEQKSETTHSSVVENLQQRIDQFNIFTINYDYQNNSYLLYFNGELLIQKKLTNRDPEQSRKIKLCAIGRQFISAENPSVSSTYGIEFKNVIFAERILSHNELEEFFNSDSQFCNIDGYGRKILKEDYQQGLPSYYNFADDLYGKVWDLTGNNNFFFSSLPAEEREGNSVI